MNLFFVVPVSMNKDYGIDYEVETCILTSSKKSYLPSYIALKEAKNILGNIFFRPLDRFLKFQLFEGVGIGALLFAFSKNVHRITQDVFDLHFILLDTVDTSPTVVLNENAKTEKQWVSFIIGTAKCVKVVHIRCGAYGSMSKPVRTGNFSKKTISAFKDFLNNFCSDHN